MRPRGGAGGRAGGRNLRVTRGQSTNFRVGAPRQKRQRAIESAVTPPVTSLSLRRAAAPARPRARSLRRRSARPACPAKRELVPPAPYLPVFKSSSQSAWLVRRMRRRTAVAVLFPACSLPLPACRTADRVPSLEPPVLVAIAVPRRPLLLDLPSGCSLALGRTLDPTANPSADSPPPLPRYQLARFATPDGGSYPRALQRHRRRRVVACSRHLVELGIEGWAGGLVGAARERRTVLRPSSKRAQGAGSTGRLEEGLADAGVLLVRADQPVEGCICVVRRLHACPAGSLLRPRRLLSRRRIVSWRRL